MATAVALVAGLSFAAVVEESPPSEEAMGVSSLCHKPFLADNVAHPQTKTEVSILENWHPTNTSMNF